MIPINLDDLGETEKVRIARMEKEMKEVVDQLFNYFNNFSYTDQAIAFNHNLNRQHNTLQQNFWRMICYNIQLFADNKFIDARNQDSSDFCKRLKKLCKESGFSTI